MLPSLVLHVGLLEGFLAGQGLSRPKCRAWRSRLKGHRTKVSWEGARNESQVPNLGRNVGLDPMPPSPAVWLCSLLHGAPSCPVPPAGLDSRHPGTGVSALALVTFGTIL